MNEPVPSESRIGQLDAFAAILEAKLHAIDAKTNVEDDKRIASPKLTAPIVELPTNIARELVESTEADLLALAKRWSDWRTQLQQWEQSQTGA